VSRHIYVSPCLRRVDTFLWRNVARNFLWFVGRPLRLPLRIMMISQTDQNAIDLITESRVSLL
jgi:hypothetical protein